MIGEWVEEYTRTERARVDRIARALAAVVFGATLLLATCAAAQDACPDSGEHSAPRRLQLAQQGEEGIWFRLDVARCMLGDLRELEPSRARIRLLEERLVLRDEQTVRLREAVDLGRQAETRALEALEAAVRRTADAERALAFERDLRWVWFGVGVVVVVALEALAIWIFSEVSP